MRENDKYGKYNETKIGVALRRDFDEATFVPDFGPIWAQFRQFFTKNHHFQLFALMRLCFTIFGCELSENFIANYFNGQ